MKVWFLTPPALALCQGPARLPSLVVGLELLPEELGEHLHTKETVWQILEMGMCLALVTSVMG